MQLSDAVSLSGRDLKGHLIGTQAVIHASNDRASAQTASHFRQACLLGAFRQELYIGLTAQRPVQYSIPSHLAELLTDDWCWAKVAVTDCATVVNHVYGEETTPERTALLSQGIRNWQEDVPQSFRPLGDEEALQGCAASFPSCPMLAPCHGKVHTGDQMYTY